MDSHAQKEIREYATAIGREIVAPLFPLAWEAFEDYRLGAMFLTRMDTEMIHRVARSGLTVNSLPNEWKAKRCRERDECFEKLLRLRIVDKSHVSMIKEALQ